MDITVLIAEDNLDNRIIYRDFLVHSGCRVIEASNGREALDRCREHRPDVVLMDLSMPVLDGWEATRALKEDPDTASIPVLALSAHVVLDGDYRKATEAGFVSYLTKPIEARRVLAEIERALSTTGRTGEDG
ncbi:MAG: response regulator [Gemmatimonadota bacterium]